LGVAWFDEATFERTVWFSGARFTWPAQFGWALFNGDVKFGAAQFGVSVAFDGAGARLDVSEQVEREWPVGWVVRRPATEEEGGQRVGVGSWGFVEPDPEEVSSAG
jgi:hypothetical protein